MCSSERGLKAFGPDKRAARLEASKDFAKRLMLENGIPTAEHQTFTDAEAAMAYIEDQYAPVFVKANGLAAGKGVIPGRTFKEALQAVTTILVDRAFGDAGDSVVIEEELIGEEASFTVLTDGTHCLPFVSSQDHKMSHDGDTGKNTGRYGRILSRTCYYARIARLCHETRRLPDCQRNGDYRQPV